MNKDQLRLYNKQRRELIDRVMADVQVVITLPFNVKEMLRRNFNPQFVIFGEASLSATRISSIGDHKQLSHPVFTPAGEAAWSKSAFERLIEKEYHQTLLNIPSRSYKDLYEPTSVAYYEGKVDTFRNQPSGDLNITSANPLRVRLADRTWTLRGLSHFLHLPHIQGSMRKDPSGSLFHQQEAELSGSAWPSSSWAEPCVSNFDSRAWLLVEDPRQLQPVILSGHHLEFIHVKTIDSFQSSEATVVILDLSIVELPRFPREINWRLRRSTNTSNKSSFVSSLLWLADLSTLVPLCLLRETPPHQTVIILLAILTARWIDIALVRSYGDEASTSETACGDDQDLPIRCPCRKSTPNHVLTKIRQGANYIFVERSLLGNWAAEWRRFVDLSYPLIKEMVFVICHGNSFEGAIKFDNWTAAHEHNIFFVASEVYEDWESLQGKVELQRRGLIPGRGRTSRGN
ncbi:P-loop containing nucleoside triphosphate hydrolase protein [Aspergillus terreus]|uniref:P-loop containing nucleoside triphosphate hydrolase protein n=1 Tax=Aspergillus terreus TaxID=33178 RepID=A0A5M3ZHE5_ASPTE|nr:hypothetical protein ATETN484_0016019900 [Aspergillus terreus]GFF21628.1 P-loop containing nucleoside triphosphate hydrolase protein [Aspergillus terreus]